jgi:hypothetical protein
MSSSSIINFHCQLLLLLQMGVLALVTFLPAYLNKFVPWTKTSVQYTSNLQATNTKSNKSITQALHSIRENVISFIMRKQLSRGILVLLPKLIFNLFRRSLHTVHRQLVLIDETRKSAKMDRMKNEGKCYDFKLQRCHFLEQKVAFSMSFQK